MVKQLIKQIVKRFQSVERNNLYEIIAASSKRLALLVVLGAIFLTGLACDVRTAVAGRALSSLSSGSMSYDGTISLEETILDADVIVRGRLNSVDRGVDVWKLGTDVVYSQTLEFTFDVTEYLKGTGDDQVVGLVFDDGFAFKTRLGAELGKDIDPERKNYWDDREAIVFLKDDSKDPRISLYKNRYRLGLVTHSTWERYSIRNDWYNPWLPAAKSGGDLFLLEHDKGAEPPRTVSFDDLKSRISYIDQQLAGRSEEYKDCVRYSYSWQRRTLYTKESLDGDYYHTRSTANVVSGMPMGTLVHTSRFAGFQIAGYRDMDPPKKKDEYVIAGHDAQYFVSEWPGEVFTDRPLPAGYYTFFHAYLPYPAHICGGTIPEDEMGRQELFVDVDAPEGTVFEAFFDPIEDGTTLSATFPPRPGASYPPIRPWSPPIVVERIAWEPGTVRMRVSPPDAVADQTVDFIALDGSVTLSLLAADAQVEAGTLVWAVESQPWQSGDKLMVRVSA